MSSLCITIVKRSSSRVEKVVSSRSQYHDLACPLGAGASSFLGAPPAWELSACFLFPAFMSIPAIVAMTALMNQKNHLLEKYLPKVARKADVAMAKPTAIEMPRVS